MLCTYYRTHVLFLILEISYHKCQVIHFIKYILYIAAPCNIHTFVKRVIVIIEYA